MNTNIILFSISKNIFYQQALFLINSILIKKDSSVKLNVFTDSLKWIPLHAQKVIQIFILDDKEIRLLKGKQSFIHNIKIALIEKIANEQGGNIIYIDSDCFLIKNLDEIFEKIQSGYFIMHRKETHLKNLHHNLKLIIDSFKNPSLEYKSLVEKFNLNDDYYMWNAGVIGGSSSALLSVIGEVYKLTEFIYQVSQSHVSEQLAFSIVFQKFGTIYPAEDCIYHYWPSDEKLFMQDFIDGYLKSSKYNLDSLIFSKLPKIILNSYSICRSRAIHSLECNSFKKGYHFSLRAFVAHPFLDKEFAIILRFHILRHLKHLAKVALGKL